MFFKAEPDGNAVSFYMEDHKMAEKLMHADRTIQMPNGFKMLIRVRSSIPPTNIDDALKERMKVVMAKRYNAQTKALDLTKFHTDPDLSDIFCALFRPSIMLAAINIIGENIPDMEALNLNDNKLHNLDHFKQLVLKAPNIKILYLGNNKVKVFIFLLKTPLTIIIPFPDSACVFIGSIQRIADSRSCARGKSNAGSFQRSNPICQVFSIIFYRSWVKNKLMVICWLEFSYY